MKPLRLCLLALLCALASACATTGHAPALAAPAADAAAVADGAVATDAGETPAAGTAAVAATEATPDAMQAADAASADAESDFDAIYGDGAAAGNRHGATAYDPWEKYNRRVHAFNASVDRGLAKPLAQAYVAVVPRPLRAGIGNFFDNLEEPATVVNSLLQGNPRGAVNALGRFLLNSTLGIGGLFDLADKAKMPNRGEDFGQTMATWGWKRSRYLEIPFLGPRTLRDLFGLAADSPLRPLHHLEDDKARLFLSGLQAVDLRAQLLAIEAIGEGAVDEYTLYRDIWLQRRNYQIHQGATRKAKQPDADLPPYLLEDGQDAAPEDPPGKPAGG